MNSRSAKSLALFATLFATGLFSAPKAPKVPKKSKASKSEKAPKMQLPKLIIKTINNTTDYDIMLVDRLAKDKSIVLSAGKTIEVNFKTKGQNEVVINGSMADVMSKDAQYVFKKLDQNGNPEPDQEVYFNLYMSPGGVDNGSGFITGTPGSITLNFYVAGKNGGCMMNSGRVNAEGCQMAEFELELSIDEKDVRLNTFRMNVGGELTCK